MQATTAIEGNTLPLEQVTALLDGKRVRGPAREVPEVENAIAAYALVPTLDPSSERDLLRAHAAALAESDRAGDATAFVSFMLQVLLTALEEFLRDYRPTRLDAAARLELAATHFGARTFSRKDYLELHPTLSAPTASRDLREGIERARLRIEGDKRTARYAFRRTRGTRLQASGRMFRELEALAGRGLALEQRERPRVRTEPRDL